MCILNSKPLSYIIVIPSLIIAQFTNNTSHLQCQNLLNLASGLTISFKKFKNSSCSIRVPPEATMIRTLLQPKELQRALSTHPDKPLTRFSIAGLTNGFKIGFNNPTFKLHSAHKAWRVPFNTSQVVDDYMKVEIAEHHVAGPFHKADIRMPILADLASSPSNTNLTNLVELSINDGIPKDLCSLSYVYHCGHRN